MKKIYFSNVADSLQHLPPDAPFLETGSCLSLKDMSNFTSTFSSSNRKTAEQGVGGITGIDVTPVDILSNMYV